MSAPNSSSPLPSSMGPGARPIQPGESPGSLLSEISEIRSHYNVHVDTSAINLSYNLNNKTRHYSLPFDNIPLHGLSRSLTYGGPNAAKVSGILLIDVIRASENITGKPVTQQEAEGFAYYTSKKLLYMFAGNLSGLTLGYYLAWRGRKDMKFPFMKPKPAERYENFPNRYLPLLRGQFARIMWHITRANVYAAIGLFALNPFFRSMGDVSMTVGLYRDPRTHDLVDSMKGELDRLKSNRAQAAASKILQKNQPEQPESTDTASPQPSFGDNDSYGSRQDYQSDTTFTDGTTDTGVLNDSDMRQKESQQRPSNAWTRGQAKRIPSNQQSKKSSSGDFFFDDDDASPTAGNDPDMATPKPYNPQNQGSAWDRIRRGVASQNRSSPTTRQTPPRDQSQEFASQSDSFSFSNEQEERQLAKDVAQREFDAMLDRERQTGGSSEYVRDMQATEAGVESSRSTGSAWERRRN